jgi:hypothetical protein
MKGSHQVPNDAHGHSGTVPGHLVAATATAHELNGSDGGGDGEPSEGERGHEHWQSGLAEYLVRLMLMFAASDGKRTFQNSVRASLGGCGRKLPKPPADV